VPGQLRVPVGRVTIVGMALVGLATTLGSIVLALVPAPDDANPLLTAFKVVGMTATLLITGGAVYVFGRKRGLHN
jgi:hypothetical protein